MLLFSGYRVNEAPTETFALASLGLVRVMRPELHQRSHIAVGISARERMLLVAFPCEEQIGASFATAVVNARCAERTGLKQYNESRLHVFEGGLVSYSERYVPGVEVPLHLCIATTTLPCMWTPSSQVVL